MVNLGGQVPLLLRSSHSPLGTSLPALNPNTSCLQNFCLLTCLFNFQSIAGVGMGGEGKQSVLSHGPGQPQMPLADSSLFFLRFPLPFLATIKPPNVTCIPKVRSIQMIVHPTSTPVHTGDGHRLTLEDIFHDLSYHLELQVNHTYQMVNICASLVLHAWETHFPLNEISVALGRKMCFLYIFFSIF